MPLTEKGSEIKKAMVEEYGPKKGEEVFYARANTGNITGVHDTPEYTQVEPELTLPELQRRNEQYWRQSQNIPLQPDVNKSRPV